MIIDAKEQAIRRPGDWEAEEPFYSGKKKRHTVKNRVACTPHRGHPSTSSITAPDRPPSRW